MKRPVRHVDGTYHIAGKRYPQLFGSRRQVWANTAYKTAGNLTKNQLVLNRWNRIVSANKHRSANAEQRLRRYGYTAKKGKFGAVKMATTQRRSI